MVVVADVTGRGGAQIGGTATLVVSNGGGQVPSDAVVEWDLDNDGDFSEAAEQRTSDVLSLETETGRDWPSQLTGKAAPGRFRARLRNHQDEYAYFNQNSPLNQAPFSLDTGRKLRVRTADAADPDPVLIARDRFRRPDGPLTTLETGQAWVTPSGVNPFTVVNEVARTTVEGFPHAAIVDIGVDEYVLQITIGRNMVGDASTYVGIIYRWVDANNFSMVRVRRTIVGTVAELELVDAVAGVPTIIDSSSFTYQTYEGLTFGIATIDGNAVAHSEGVLLDTITAPLLNDGSTVVGIIGDWIEHVPPEVAEFWAWDRPLAETEGVLWTGDVADVLPDVDQGQEKTASLKGEGWLSKLATNKITFPGLSAGQFTTFGVGKVLTETGMNRPPSMIPAEGRLTGPVGLEELDAIEVARRFEETDLGFLHETQEGPINFDSRSARVGATPQAVFSDDPDDQFHYYSPKLLDWRREIFNQVRSGLAPQEPFTLGTGEFSTDSSTIIEVTPDGDPGDLNIFFIVCGGVTTIDWNPPPGYVQLTTGKPDTLDGSAAADNFRIFARIIDGTEPTFVQVGTMSPAGAYARTDWEIRRWFGDIQAGIVLGEESQNSDPPPVFPPWAPDATIFIACRAGRLGTATVDGWTEQGFDGWFGGSEIHEAGTAGLHMALQSCYKIAAGAAVGVEAPAPFDGTFSGFSAVASQTLAIRGANGDPPEPTGPVIVESNDRASQDKHNAIRSYTNAANLFVNEADAELYNSLVLARHANARPLVEITFSANRDAAHRNQAIRRRVGDMIHLIADGPAGLGFRGDMFIENIRHRFTDGTTKWEVTWQLSPA